MAPTDGNLLERWRAGDRGSGEVLFDRYYDLVERFFLNKVASAVQDLVQETFTRCVEGRDRIRGEFRLYIIGIAYNVLKAHLRVRYRDGAAIDVEESAMRDMEPGPGPATLLVQRREDRLLLEALRNLPIQEQVILELHYWENLTTDEIADALELPIGTARGRLQRARDKLGEVLHRITESPHELTSTLACLEDWARDCRKHLDSYRSEK
jgi:RNA polymerase sigma-70 factor (ECF subfamily)